MKIPKKISPSPIIEAVTEIRFENELPSAVIFGKLYGALSEEFSDTEQLPILEMPAQFRDLQPELRYAPHYRLKNDKFIVNIGQRILSVNRVCTSHEYESWDEYFSVIKTVFEKVKSINLISTVERVSVRYINFLEEDVSTVLNLEIGLFKTKIDNHKELNLVFVQELNDNNKLSVGIASNAKIETNGAIREGLVVNIEAYKDTQTAVANIEDVVKKLHGASEKGFFEALNDEYLSTLKPDYND